MFFTTAGLFALLTLPAFAHPLAYEEIGSRSLSRADEYRTILARDLASTILDVLEARQQNK